MPSLSGLHSNVADDFDGTFVAVIELPQDFIGQALLGKLFERLHDSGFSVLYWQAWMLSLHFAATPRISRTLLVGSGKNSRRSSTIPTSATWKYRGFGILVDGDEERISFDPGQVLECSTDAESQIDLGLHRFSRRANLTGLLHPFRIDDRARATHRRT